MTNLAPASTAPPISSPSVFRTRISLVLTLVGWLIFAIGARPGLFGLDRSPVVGFIQISFFTIGLGIICLGGYIGLTGFWKNGDRTIAADIGSRLVATGYVIVVFSGMADVFGMGGQVYPRIPYFGPWQAMGVQVGQVVIAIGFVLLLPFRRRQPPQTHPEA
jgi:hypothetical protein